MLVGIFNHVGQNDKVGYKPDLNMLFVEKLFYSASEAELWRQAYHEASFKGEVVTVELKGETSIQEFGGGGPGYAGPGNGGGGGSGGFGGSGGSGGGSVGKRKVGRPALATMKMMKRL